MKMANTRIKFNVLFSNPRNDCYLAVRKILIDYKQIHDPLKSIEHFNYDECFLNQTTKPWKEEIF
jgi:hypothetical protein